MRTSSRSITRSILPLAISIAAAIPQVHAVTIAKDNNTNALSMPSSWVGGNVPTNLDEALWNSTVTGANTVALGGIGDWLGLRVTNPGGPVNITHAAGNLLTLGSGGIDLSAATQNLSVLSSAVAGTLHVDASQTWSVAAGRTMTLFNTTNTANVGLSGSADIQVAGAGTVIMATGDATSTGLSGGGNSVYSGNWTIGTGLAGSGRVEAQRNSVNAWGTGSITLNGGTIAQRNGSWTWTNNIVLATGTTSTIDDANTSGTTRTLKLQGVLSGSGNLVFAETGAGAQTIETGYILTNNNTLSGTVTINSPAVVRIGGVPGNDTATGHGIGGTLGTAAVVNNGTLVLARTNTWTFANQISGSGLLRIGLTSGVASHILTLGGDNSHTGGTTLQTALTLKIGHTNALGTGPFTIGGNGIFDNITGSAVTVPNALTLSGGSPTFIGTDEMTFNGAVSISGANRTITVTRGTLTLANNISEDLMRAFTKAGAGTLVMGGTNSYTGSTTVNGGTLVLDYGTNDTTKLSNGSSLLLSGVGIILAGATGSHNELVAGTTLNGMVLLTRSGTNTSEISFGGLTRNAGGFLDVQSENMANTTAVNVNGILQGVTLGGANLAMNDGANNIVVFSSYTDVTRLESGAKTIADDATQQIRVTDGMGISPAPVTLAAVGTTAINSLVNSATGGTPTVEIGTDNTLRLGAAGVLLSGAGTAGFSVNGGTLTAGAALNSAGDVLASNSGATMAISSNITNNGSGTVTFTKAGTGTVVLSGTNTYTGVTTIRQGVLALDGGVAILDSGAVTLSNVAGASLKLHDNETIGNLTGGGPLGGTVDIGPHTLTSTTAAGVQVFAGAILGSGTFVKGGTGELALEGQNTFTGLISIQAGTLAFRTLGSDDGSPAVNIAATGNLAIGLEFAGETATISALSGSGGVNPQFDQPFGIRTLNVAQNTDTVFSGVMRDSLSDTNRILGFAKSGTGTLELSGASTYVGPTTINAGTLLVSGSLSASSPVTIHGGTLAGDGPVGAVTLNGGTIAPGASPGILETGGVIFNGGTLALELNGTTPGISYDQLGVTGSVSFTANTALSLSLGFDPADGVDTFTIVANDGTDPVAIGGGVLSFAGSPLGEGAFFTAGAQSFTISYAGGDGNDVVLMAVPEPGSAAIFLVGTAMLFGLRRRGTV